MTQDFIHFLEKAKRIVAEHRAEYCGEYYMKGGWNPIRDALETAGTLVGNYYLPGSSLVTSNLASKGSQGQLDSTLGKIAQTATGLSGSGFGSSFTGIPSAAQAGAGWENAANGAGNLVGAGNVGTNIGNSFSSMFGSTPAATAGDSGFLQNAKDASQGLSTGDGGFLSSAKSALNTPAALSVGTGGGGSSYAPALIGGATSLYENEQARKALQDAETQSIGQLNPYLQSGAAANSRLSDLLGTSGNSGASGYGSLTTPFSASDLQNDPGYQFQLEEGNKALDRKSAASGNYFSGSALKAAEDYGQGLADTTLNQAYQRYLSGNQQQYSQLAGQAGVGANAATQAGNIYSGTGNAQAGADVSTGNIINQTLSSLLSGSGAKRPINVGGQIVYI